MNVQGLLSEIQADLQRAPFVLYLEGKTDPEVFFGLLGVPRPASSIHGRVYVKGLKDQGSGKTAVRSRVDSAQTIGQSLQVGAGGIFGIIDGDGRDLAALRAELDSPFNGPLFSWPAYSIENLLARTWPMAWGPAPSWPAVLQSYVPYAALNAVHVELRAALTTLGLEKFRAPSTGEPVKAVTDVKTALGQDKSLILGKDVEAMFDGQVARISNAIASSAAEGHALVNGKWLVEHHAALAQQGKAADVLRKAWAAAVRGNGGDPLVRDLWKRVTGSPP